MPRRRPTPIDLNIDPETVKRMGHAEEDNFFDRCADPNIAEALSAFDHFPGHEEMVGGFALGMMCQQLVMIEERIILAEHRPGPVIDIEEEKERYIQKRATAEKQEGFPKTYESVRKGHNECARANLDNSEGTIHTAVVPKFNPDGSHEPWRCRDVPWNAPPNE